MGRDFARKQIAAMSPRDVPDPVFVPSPGLEPAVASRARLPRWAWATLVFVGMGLGGYTLECRPGAAGLSLGQCRALAAEYHERSERLRASGHASPYDAARDAIAARWHIDRSQVSACLRAAR